MFRENGKTYWVESDKDFLISWDILDKIEEVRDQDRKYIEYNQRAWNWSTDACTLFSPLTLISSLFNEKVSDEAILDMRNYAKKNWNPKYEAKIGNSTQNWMNMVTKWWNERNTDRKVVYFRSVIDSVETQRALQKWLGIWLTIKWNAKYTLDAMEDWVLNGTSFGEATYWHTHAFFGNGDYLLWVDNYIWLKKPNRYMVKQSSLAELVANGVFYPACYIIIPLENIWMSVEMLKILTLSKDTNSRLWKLADEEKKKWKYKIDMERLQIYLAETNNLIRNLEKKI